MTAQECIVLYDEISRIQCVAEKCGIEIDKDLFNLKQETGIEIHVKAARYHDEVLPLLPLDCTIHSGMNPNFQWRREKASKNILWALSAKQKSVTQ